MTRTARQTAAALAADLGWTDVFDLGDLSAARGMEMYLPLWLRISGQLGLRWRSTSRSCAEKGRRR